MQQSSSETSFIKCLILACLQRCLKRGTGKQHSKKRRFTIQMLHHYVMLWEVVDGWPLQPVLGAELK
jgi:hypothetical protein